MIITQYNDIKSEILMRLPSLNKYFYGLDKCFNQ